MPDTIRVTCPCCETLLVVDPDTGTILREERKTRREHASLDDALGSLRSQKKEAAEKLARAMDEAKHRQEILEKKFEEARKKASESDAPPPRPFDND